MANPNYRACPVKDCVLPIDIVLRSSDGVSIGAHMKNLEQYSEGFPVVGSVQVDSNSPTLEEEAEVIELMFQFMHHTRQPDIRHIRFDLLSALAEAVEKYMIYSAMSVCEILMRLAATQHPIDGLLYAFKHDYLDFANKVAPHTLSMDSTEMVTKAKAAHVHDSFLVAWFCHRDARAKIGRSLVNNPPRYEIGGLHKGGRSDCELWATFKEATMSEFLKLDFPDPKSVAHILSSHVFLLLDCNHCQKRGKHWRDQALNAAAEEAKLF